MQTLAVVAIASQLAIASPEDVPCQVVADADSKFTYCLLQHVGTDLPYTTMLVDVKRRREGQTAYSRYFVVRNCTTEGLAISLVKDDGQVDVSSTVVLDAARPNPYNRAIKAISDYTCAR